MASFLQSLVVFLTVLISMIFPATPDGGATVTVNVPEETVNADLGYTYKNETGLVIVGDTKCEELEMKVLGEWVPVVFAEPEITEEQDAAIVVMPGANFTDYVDVPVLLPGEYRLTIVYNVCTDFGGGTTEARTSVEFTVE